MHLTPFRTKSLTGDEAASPPPGDKSVTGYPLASNQEGWRQPKKCAIPSLGQATHPSGEEEEEKRSGQRSFHCLRLFKNPAGPDQSLRMAETQTQVLEASAYLDAEVASVHIVAQEQIAGGAGGSAHLEKLHQVKELAVDIAAHWTQTHRRR